MVNREGGEGESFGQETSCAEFARGQLWIREQTTQLPSRTRNSIPQSDVQKQSFHLLSLKLMN